MALGLIVTNNRGITPLFAIPVALAAWLFPPRQAALALGCVFLMLIVINTIAVRSLQWPLPLAAASLCGIFSALIVTIAISVLRYALNMAETARQRSWQAAQEMTNAYKQEQLLNDLKDQFLLNINHELRAPLTTLHGHLQLLQEQQRLNIPPQPELLAHALHSSEELVRIVNAVLDTLHYENASLQPHHEALSVASVVQNTVDLFEPTQWQAHHIDLQIPETLKVKADCRFLQQILWNLLSNACQYSPPGTTITVSARTETDSSEQAKIRIVVQDTGPGIAPDDIPFLFGKFARLTRDQAGPVRGMGLASTSANI
jgi:signal transduction histidine kinase